MNNKFYFIALMFLHGSVSCIPFPRLHFFVGGGFSSESGACGSGLKAVRELRRNNPRECESDSDDDCLAPRRWKTVTLERCVETGEFREVTSDSATGKVLSIRELTEDEIVRCKLREKVKNES